MCRRAATTAVVLGTVAAAVLGMSAAAEDTTLTPLEVPATATNLDIRPLNNSPMMVADPTEERFVALANRLDGPTFSCALQLSGDGGRGWVPANPVPRLPPGAERCYAPEIAFDRHGTLHYLFVGLRGAGNEPMGVFLTTSSDRGRSFDSPRQVLGPGNYQTRMAIDTTTGTSDRIHLVWLSVGEGAPVGGLPAKPNPILAAYSDDAGKTFSAPVPVSDPARARVLAPALALGPDRSVHVAYYDLGDDARDYQGLEGPTWEGHWTVLAASSTDGGGRFGRSVVVDDAVAPPGRVMLVYTMPPPAVVAGPDGVHVAWTDARSGDPDVYTSRSTDRGGRWARPHRLNDDRQGNGAHQELPRLALAPDGRLDAIFYDRRDDPRNVMTDVYYAFSSDGGRRFEANRRLTTAPSNATYGPTYPIPSAKDLVEHGSRLGLLSRSGSVVAAWADIRNQRSQDVFTTTVTHPRPGSAVLRWALVAIGTAAGSAALVVLARARGRRRRTVGVGGGANAGGV